MKKFRPLVAGILVLAATAPRAGLVNTIEVTTFVDEVGGNPAHCSLREALHAVNTRSPYGGCRSGSAFDDNVIQLQAGRYVLTEGQLEVTQEVLIAGADSQAEANADLADPLTGETPRRFRPDYEDADPAIGKTGTWVVADTGSRIAYATAQLTLRDMVLIGSADASQLTPSPVAGNGGVIYAASIVALENVIVRGGAVTGSGLTAGNGGALYLGGDDSALTLTDSTLEYNSASNTGGAIAMLCSVNLNPYARHTVTVTRSLLRGNSAPAGAGGVAFCGNATGAFTASTLSANSSLASSGALAYVQESEVGIGSIALEYVTALEQEGPVLALGGVAEVRLYGSLLSASDVMPRANVCIQPDPAVDMMTATNPGGRRNAIDGDGSCTPLLSASGNNVSITPGTAHTDYMVDIQSDLAGPAGYYPTTAAAGPYGLTDYYMPRTDAASSPVLDLADPIADCVFRDQRNVLRRSGANCDIGAVERLQVSASDDEGVNQQDTDRLAVIDILDNDTYGEGDVSGPYSFDVNTAASPAIILVDDADGACTWKLADATENAGLLEVRNGGALTPDGSPVICTYRAVDSSGAQSPMIASVEVQFKNVAPRAINDAFLRPVGEREVVFDPMTNDNDEGDGIYGLVRTVVPNPVPSLPATVTYGPETAWASFYPVEILQKPALGEVVGASSGICPGSESLPRTCLTPPLRYQADNNLSPFSDSFTYRVYDADGEGSNAATVTIYTDAPDPDRGGGGGSLDWLWGLALGLLGLRRFRKL